MSINNIPYYQRRMCLLLIPDSPSQWKDFLGILAELIEIQKRTTRPPQITLCGKPHAVWVESTKRSGIPFLEAIPADLSPFLSIAGMEAPEAEILARMKNDGCIWQPLHAEDFRSDPFAAACRWLRIFLRPALYARSLSLGEN